MSLGALFPMWHGCPIGRSELNPVKIPLITSPLGRNSVGCLWLPFGCLWLPLQMWQGYACNRSKTSRIRSRRLPRRSDGIRVLLEAFFLHLVVFSNVPRLSDRLRIQSRLRSRRPLRRSDGIRLLFVIGWLPFETKQGGPIDRSEHNPVNDPLIASPLGQNSDAFGCFLNPLVAVSNAGELSDRPIGMFNRVWMLFVCLGLIFVHSAELSDRLIGAQSRGSHRLEGRTEMGCLSRQRPSDRLAARTKFVCFVILFSATPSSNVASLSGRPSKAQYNLISRRSPRRSDGIRILWVGFPLW